VSSLHAKHPRATPCRLAPLRRIDRLALFRSTFEVERECTFRLFALRENVAVNALDLSHPVCTENPVMRGDRVVPITCPARSPGANHLGQAWISIESSGLGGQFRAGCFHRPHIHIKQSVALVALVFVLLPQLDDFPEDFHIKTLSLGL
jgi:hypothetical protein